jgi:uncharacterized membrane protein
LAPVLGGILGLLAAATFAFNNAAVRRGVLTGSVAQALAITVPIGVPIFVAAALATGSLAVITTFSPLALVYLASAGIVHFVWGRYCNFRATKAMGANLVGPVQQVGLLLTLALAVWILGETLTPLRAIGIFLVVLGPMLTLPGKETTPGTAQTAEPVIATAETTPAKASADAVPPFQVNYAEGYLWSLLSALGYGSSPILVTLGLQSKGLAGSLAGGVVSYTAATAVAALVLLWPGQLRHVLLMRANNAKWFTLSGVLVCLSQRFLYMGFAIAPVSVVSPIQRLSIVFRIYAGWLLNREHEVFGGKVILGTVISLVGAIALSVSTEVVLAYVPLPDAIVGIARWHWP